MNNHRIVPSTLVIATIALFLAGPVTAMESPKFDSGVLEQGEAFTWHTDEAGVWEYYCAFHGGMSGTINVTSGDGMGQVVEIRIENNMLHPENVTVPLGADVKWTNFDARNHTITQGHDAMMGDGMMGDGTMGKTDDAMMDDDDGMMDDGADSPGLGVILVLAAGTVGLLMFRRRR